MLLHGLGLVEEVAQRELRQRDGCAELEQPEKLDPVVGREQVHADIPTEEREGRQTRGEKECRVRCERVENIGGEGRGGGGGGRA